MLVKFMSLFLESSVWKFHTCDLNMKHWHQLRQMRIYKATFFKLINVIFLIAFIFIYLFLFYFWLCWVFVSARGLSLVVASGATLHRGVLASHCRGLSCCGAQAPDAQAQQLWLTGPVAPRHVGSSQTRARTCVACIGRQNLNHCATREAPCQIFDGYFTLISCFNLDLSHFKCLIVTGGSGCCVGPHRSR